MLSVLTPAAHRRAGSRPAYLSRLPRPIAGRVAAAALAAALCAVPAVAQTDRPATASATPRDTLVLTLAEARRLALRANRELTAARFDTAIAGGELRQARTRLPSNPTAEVLGGGGGLGAEPGVSQQIEVFNPRGARVTAGLAGVERARAAITDVTRRTLGDVDRAFYRLAASLRRGALADTVLVLNSRIATAAARQLQAGEISRLDYNLALVESGRAQSRALAARREANASAVELSRLLGLPTGTPLVPALDSTRQAEGPLAAGAPAGVPAGAPGPGEPHAALRLDVDSLTALALARRPDIAERAAAARQSTALAAAARREALPNLVLRATSERGDGGRVFRPGVGLTLPVFNLNRGAVAARRAQAQQAELERTALAARVRADVASAVTTYTSAAREVDVLGTTVLAPARQNRQLLETAYREGEVGLPVLLLIRNQVIDAELEYWSAWLAEREALTALAEITGQNLEEARVP